MREYLPVALTAGWSEWSEWSERSLGINIPDQSRTPVRALVRV